MMPDMKAKRRYWVLMAALLIPITFAGAHTEQILLGQSEEVAKTRDKLTDEFVDALVLAKENYAGEVDFDRLTKTSIIGMLNTLDPHSSYLDPKEFGDFLSKQRSRYSGIGSTILQYGDKVYIISPFNGTPAHRAGIRYGDHIVEVNGESTEGLNSRQVSNKLLGPEGTPVSVKVARAGHGAPLEFKLIRASVPLPSITNYHMLGKGVGYINLDGGFNTTTHEEMRRALMDLREHGMTSLVLDLRRNPGGLVDQAQRVSNLFLFRGQKIVTMRGRPSVFPAREYMAVNNDPEPFPLVILIGRGTASAAEIVAGALQDHDRARLVGEDSFGKALVQNIFQLRDGSGLTLTTGHYYTPSGRLIQREYAGRSFYDYYLRRGDDETPTKTDEKRTDNGRAVYGGGGIQPDVEVKVPGRELELQRYWVEAIFQFTRRLVNGQIAGLGEFKLTRPSDHKHRLTSSDYQINDKVLAAFKDFVRANKELGKNESQIDKDADWIKRWIRYEVVMAAYGQEIARQVLLEGDQQLLKGLSEMPKARAMAEEFLREHIASRSGNVVKD
jgi:carboxyl-terminal processing protease